MTGQVATGGGPNGKDGTNPMQSAHAAPRCHAHSKRTGLPCRSPAVRGWHVCRMHGARGGAPEGRANGAFQSGAYTLETKADVACLRELERLATETLENLVG